MPQYDSAARKVYVNLRRTNEIAEIDPATDTVTARFPWKDASITMAWRSIPRITARSCCAEATALSRS